MINSESIHTGSASVSEYMRENERIRIVMEDYKRCMSSINILRYLVESRNQLPLSVSKHIFVDYDILFIIAGLLQSEPWVRINSITCSKEKWTNEGWSVSTEGLCTVEGNCWIALLSLLDSDQIRSGNYQLTSSRTNALLNLRKLLTDTVVIQIPPLDMLRRYLEELRVGATIGAPTFVANMKPRVDSSSAFAIVEIEDRLFETLKSRLPLTIAPLTPDEQRTVAAQLCEVWGDCVDMNSVAANPSAVFACAVCAKPSENRCSVCKAVAYCNRECQINDWQNHKTRCSATIRQ